MVKFLDQAVKEKDEKAQKFAMASLDAKRIYGMLALAQSGRVVTPGELDANPDLLNFLNGTVNLKTGELRSHARTDFITKLVHHAYRTDAACDLWLSFLDSI